MASSSFTRCPIAGDAKLLQGLVRQARENRLVYVILAECRLILPEAQAPQPDHNVHDDAHNRGRRTSSAGAANVSRVVLAGLRASQSPLRSGLFDFSQKQIWFIRCSS